MKWNFRWLIFTLVKFQSEEKHVSIIKNWDSRGKINALKISKENASCVTMLKNDKKMMSFNALVMEIF